jgi:DUF4097 and DUF4098 domain-containing protein YvlB
MQQNTYEHTGQTMVNERSVNTDPRENAVQGRPIYPGWQSRRRTPWRLLAICAIALVVAWTIFSLTGGLSLTSMQKTLPTRAFSLSGHGTLVVNEINGNVHIHPGDTNQIIVRGSEHAVGLESSLNNLQVQYAQSGNTVTVSSSENWALAGDSELSLDITVPASIDITIHNSSADATIDGITGPIDASASSGNLELNDTNGPLNLNTSSGDISLNNEHGSVSAHTTSGDISARGLTGPVNLSTSSGNITLEQAQLSSQDHLQTTSGDIDVSGTLDPRGTYRMETSSGNITLNLPATSSFQLSTSSDSGELHNDFAATQTGGAPYARIELQTSSGDMFVRRQ